jgi:hypothetical protein
MHYIRLLRSPQVSISKGKPPSIALVLTVTTDLGDSFLFIDDLIKLSVNLYAVEDGERHMPIGELDGKGLNWTRGARVLKLQLPIPPVIASALQKGKNFRMCIKPQDDMISVAHLRQVVDIKDLEGVPGHIMPVWVDLVSPSQKPSHVATRRINTAQSGPANVLEVEEEIGESIARHIWDAGVLTALHLALEVPTGNVNIAEGSISRLRERIQSRGMTWNILELGCGVGILGISVATVLSRANVQAHDDSLVLLTDLPDAEERVQANIQKFNAAKLENTRTRLLYENLDWNGGKDGHFGPLAISKMWDLVILSDCTYNADVLPALVGTLSALHAHNDAKECTNNKSQSSLRVLLATKPRHSSEQALFELMSKDSWTICDRENLPLPVLGGEPQAVEIYLFERRS